MKNGRFYSVIAVGIIIFLEGTIGLGSLLDFGWPTSPVISQLWTLLVLSFAAVFLISGLFEVLNASLREAAASGYTTVVRILARCGADVNDSFNGTALYRASKAGHVETVTALCELGAEVNNNEYHYNTTALMCAAENGRTEIIDVLRSFNADLNAKDSNGKSAIFRAAEYGHVRALLRLLECGALNSLSGSEKSSVLALVLYRRSCTLDVLSNFIERGTKVTFDVLCAAVNQGNISFFQFLLDKYESDRNEIFTTLLERVRFYYGGKNETLIGMVKHLIQSGADVNKSNDDDGSTILIRAAGVGCLEMVKVLLELGADPTARDYNEKTARSWLSSGFGTCRYRSTDIEMKIVRILSLAQEGWEKSQSNSVPLPRRPGLGAPGF